jgi:hypothetical protein
MGKIIEDDRLIPACEQLCHDHASDVARATGYQYSLRHRLRPASSDGIIANAAAMKSTRI